MPLILPPEGQWKIRIGAGLLVCLTLVLASACASPSGSGGSGTPVATQGGSTSPVAQTVASPVASPSAARVSGSPVALGSPAASPVAAASPAASPSAEVQFVSDTTWDDFEDLGGDGPSNLVQVENRSDGRFRARGSARLHRISGSNVSPSNGAYAQSRCTDCQSVAVAVQVVLYRRGAPTVAPKNVAVAVNSRCTRCVTVARAIQYVIPVDDPKAIPRDVDELVKGIDREMRYFERIKDVTRVDPDEAEARFDALVQQHASLAQYLNDLRDVKTGSDEGTPGATPSAAPSPSVAASTTATGTPAARATSGATSTPSRPGTVTPVPAVSPGTATAGTTPSPAPTP